ncbi:MAG: hypothetical protein AVO33_05035 [delta proteobacterium ML8_F1]|nr:MAG: hypothetical protein AVO33_05035 [delta proteobacterium ML8_F1]
MKKTTKKISMLLTISVMIVFSALMPSLALSLPVAGAEKETPAYVSFSGIVKTIEDEENSTTILEVTHETHGMFYLVIEDETYLVNGDALEAGAEVEGFLKSDVPITLIYPPRYPAEVVVVKEASRQVTVDYFSEELISSDKTLKLNPTDDLPVTDRFGRPFEGDIACHNLVVTYGAATKSIPAQTTPLEIVVLTENENTIYTLKVEEMPIVVEDQIIETPRPFFNAEGYVMLPLRAIAEALELTVSWDEKKREVLIDGKIIVPVGRDLYRDAGGNQHSLGTAPVIINGRTFVPISFFRNVLALNNAYVFEGQIEINNGEQMH